MNITIGKYDISIGKRRRGPWSKWSYRWSVSHWSEGVTHFCWGFISILIEDWTLEIHPICALCGGTEIGEVCTGDEGLTVCDDCGAIEQGYKYVNKREWENL